MKVWELREKLELLDGEMEIVVLDWENNAYDFQGIGFDHRGKKTTLAIKFE
ncbi:hypothetical protein P3F01_15555 [Clostridium perfringens]|uniref:hypothetical protein n=1 Tax=Clostridium perfringens TaxID=1502 RepID=UPI0028E1215A|nr:hypothetical protein [Clostridium perfringens]MDT9337775.1 hypothetical protein [Clostridium perfringens]MDT9345532.1 hypothetical protein [Clostridium perfringens]MDT9348775.1 hypothetical protein [Clostridium perfringens]MDT9354623.1 hypothetical protein [Clostridium perfringens]HDI3014024.1 hypothetical protein [Clostridium perfringens]